MPTIDLSTVIKIALRAVFNAVGNPVVLVTGVASIFVALVAYVSNGFNVILGYIPNVSDLDFSTGSSPFLSFVAFLMDWGTLFKCMDFVISVTSYFVVYFLAFSASVISAIVLIVGIRCARQLLKDWI